MKRRGVSIGLIAVLFSALLLATGCEAPAAEEHVDGIETDHVTIGIQSNPQFMPIYIAKEQARIEEALAVYGVSVTWNEYPTGIPLNRALNTGSCQLGLIGDVPTVLGISTYDKTEVIGIASRCPDNYELLINAGSSISSAEDLAGKRVGVVYGSTAHLMLKKYMENAGHTIDELELVDIAVGNVSSELDSGTIDAVAIWEPHGVRMVESGVGRILARGGSVGFGGVFSIAARKDFAEENPLLCKILLDEYARAAEEIDTVDYETWYNVASDLSIREAMLADIRSFYTYNIEITDEDIAAYQETADFLYELDIIAEPLSVEEYFNKDLLHYGE